MKSDVLQYNIFTILGVAAISVVPLVVSAQTENNQSTLTLGPDRPEQRYEPSAIQPGLIIVDKVSELIGREVKNKDEETLGSVRELAVDVESGRIVAVILSTGGFLGIERTETAIPPAALTHDSAKKYLILGTGNEKLKSAPPLDPAKWSESFSYEQLFALYKRFDQESAFDFVAQISTGQSTELIPVSRLNYIQRASQLMGMKVTDLQEAPIGEVTGILADLASGRLTVMIVTTSEFLGITDQLNAIPPGFFRFNRNRTGLHLDTTRKQLETAPHFTASEWPDFSRTSVIDSVFAAYSIPMYPIYDESQSGNRKFLGTPSDGQEDLASTMAIKKEIRALKEISLYARNVSVITKDGMTTLSGLVATEEEKSIISEIANRNVGSASVDNQLKIKTKKTAE
ncbi:MAG: hypothetical protein CMO55_08140 [Verrucomicrobiales bacterium]|nr:hypothetical protein [Verrucomicrobiales bacterium]